MENEDKKLIRRVEKLNPSKSFLYEAFDLNKKITVSKFTPIGTRVLVGRHPDYFKLYLMRYREAGEKYYPNGGIDVWNVNEDRLEKHYIDSVVLHPSNQIAKVREIHDSNGNVVYYQLAERIPVTKNDEKIARKLLKREQKMEKMAIKEAKIAKKEEKEKLKRDKQHKKLIKMREIEERIKKKENVKKEISKKLDEFINPSKSFKIIKKEKSKPIKKIVQKKPIKKLKKVK